MTDYATLLKDNSLKATFQRMQFLEKIEEYGHMSIDDIYSKVIKMHPSLSLATVYKNIILMVKNGVLVEVPIDGKKSKYELKKEEHIHLICTECGDVKDKPHIQKTDIILKELASLENFRLKKQQFNLYGICNNCQSKEVS